MGITGLEPVRLGVFKDYPPLAPDNQGCTTSYAKYPDSGVIARIRRPNVPLVEADTFTVYCVLYTVTSG